MKKLYSLMVAIVLLGSCSTVKVINSDNEPVPTKIKNTAAESVPVNITNQPIQTTTTITNDLSAVKVNNKENEPIPVKITNPDNGNPGQGTGDNQKIYFRFIHYAVSSPATVPFEISQANLVSGVIPHKQFDYIVTSAYWVNESDIQFFLNGDPHAINYPAKVYAPIPFNSADQVKINNINVVIVGYIIPPK